MTEFAVPLLDLSVLRITEYPLPDKRTPARGGGVRENKKEKKETEKDKNINSHLAKQLNLLQERRKLIALTKIESNKQKITSKQNRPPPL